MKGKKVDLPKIQASLCNSLYNVDKCVDLLGVLCLFECYSKDKHQVQKYGELEIQNMLKFLTSQITIEQKNIANIFDIVAPFNINK